MYKILKCAVVFSLIVGVSLPEVAEAKASRISRIHKVSIKRNLKQRPVRVRKVKASKRVARTLQRAKVQRQAAERQRQARLQQAAERQRQARLQQAAARQRQERLQQAAAERQRLAQQQEAERQRQAQAQQKAQAEQQAAAEQQSWEEHIRQQVARRAEQLRQAQPQQAAEERQRQAQPQQAAERQRQEEQQRREAQALLQKSRTYYYDLLGINLRASNEQIVAGYKKKAMQYHPDKNLGTDTGEIMKDIISARAVLINADTRKLYDRVGHTEYERLEKINGVKKDPDVPQRAPRSGFRNPFDFFNNDFFNNI